MPLRAVRGLFAALRENPVAAMVRTRRRGLRSRAAMAVALVIDIAYAVFCLVQSGGGSFGVLWMTLLPGVLLAPPAFILMVLGTGPSREMMEELSLTLLTRREIAVGCLLPAARLCMWHVVIYTIIYFVPVFTSGFTAEFAEWVFWVYFHLMTSTAAVLIALQRWTRRQSVRWLILVEAPVMLFVLMVLWTVFAAGLFPILGAIFEGFLASYLSQLMTMVVLMTACPLAAFLIVMMQFKRGLTAAFFAEAYPGEYIRELRSAREGAYKRLPTSQRRRVRDLYSRTAIGSSIEWTIVTVGAVIVAVLASAIKSTETKNWWEISGADIVATVLLFISPALIFLSVRRRADADCGGRIPLLSGRVVSSLWCHALPVATGLSICILIVSVLDLVARESGVTSNLPVAIRLAAIVGAIWLLCEVSAAVAVACRDLLPSAAIALAGLVAALITVVALREVEGDGSIAIFFLPMSLFAILAILRQPVLDWLHHRELLDIPVGRISTEPGVADPEWRLPDGNEPLPAIRGT